MNLPRATYRLQFTPDFGFAQAIKILPYLAALGISHIYASPIFKARKKSSHGYDIVDPSAVNPELGGEEEFEKLAREAQRLGLGWIQDIVPNHMAYDSQNELLMDVLERGPESEFHKFFDVDWDHPYESIRGRIVVPFLGKFYGEALENSEIRLAYVDGILSINYFDKRIPLSVSAYLKFFGYGLKRLEEKPLGRQNSEFIKYAGHVNLLETISALPSPEEKKKQFGFFKEMMREACDKHEDIRNFVDENLAIYNGRKGKPESFDLLDDLLSSERFRLAFWKVAADETNYRRFFNINELISLRVEDDDVFARTHSLIARLAAEGKINGVRIDHIDGLWDPRAYVEKLRTLLGNDVYIVAEKILQSDEELPDNWPLAGTTGYDFLNYANGLFCRKDSRKEFAGIYYKFAGLDTPYENLAADKKRMMIGRDMAGDIDNLARLFKNAAGRDRYGSDITLYGLKRAMVEVMAVFPTYRTYASPSGFSDSDKDVVRRAIQAAAEKLPDHSYELSYMERFMLLNYPENADAETRERWLKFVMRFQQFTGPLMAKGFEDTLLYVYNKLVSLNEVGGDPSRFGFSVGEFHEFCRRRRRKWPHTMNATATHDTKRGEDVRARINVLSEMPDVWGTAIKYFARINRKKKKKIRGEEAPSRNDEYLIYQTLAGAWPAECLSAGAGTPSACAPDFAQRIKNYVIKAIREAKTNTTWLKPREDYENACLAFVDGILSDSPDNKFPPEFVPLAARAARLGFYNSLSQTLLKMTVPGVPDFYQGSELWDLNLVDPDNRRAVDWAAREAALKNATSGADVAGILADKTPAAAKIFIIAKTLAFRKEEEKLFASGEYLPLEISGALQESSIAFARRHENKWIIVVCPRLLSAVLRGATSEPVGAAWGNTRIILPDGAPAEWRNIFTGANVGADGASIPVSSALANFPAAVLVGNT
ncbi:MAG: malto-oligosyltrehalose synthase [Elusimicrobia bacterium HGW-Elusimicrobia-1]|jgi:(1->4)-alpha-D-glucan 1-alpha-D-glucosylmutase|nr:MAG: malto-oligosyltrehalose synthase [Elusimicrobia bacterium HGW-Elusimicrobia-1]